MPKPFQANATFCCGNCRYFRERTNVDGEAQGVGHCMLNPPMTIWAQYQSDEDTGPFSERPTVRKSDWCHHQNRRDT